jgi:hypothetical protein
MKNLIGLNLFAGQSQLRLTIAALLLLVISPVQGAVLSLDQQNPITSSSSAPVIYSNQAIAQAFTVGIAGTLTQVDLALATWDTTSVDSGFTVSIYNGGGLPDASSAPVFTQDYDYSYVPMSPDRNNAREFTAFDVAAAGIDVSVGDELTIVVSSQLVATNATDWYLWSRGIEEGYSGGAGYVRNAGRWFEYSYDLAFQTHVSAIPIPAAAWLFGSALAGLGWFRRKAA